VAVIDVLDALPAGWDALLGPGQGVVGADFLRACTGTLPGLRWRPLVARGGGALSGGAPAFLHAVRLLPGLRARVLELGPPCCPGPGLLARDPGVAGELLAAIDAQVGRDVDLIAVRDVAGAGGDVAEDLHARGFALLTMRDTFVVDTGFASFDAYLGAMRAPYRRRAAQLLARPLRARVVDRFGDRAGELARLVGLTTARSRDSRAEIVDAAVIRAWSECARTAALLIDDGGALLSAGLLVDDPPVLHFLRCGFDERVGRDSGAYLRLLYELVRHAIARGCRYLDLGVTSAEPKLRIGARPLALAVYGRHRNPLAQAALRARGRRLRAEPIEIRHVFRDEQPPIDPFWYR
jgi:hypothetical protein